MNVYAPKQKLLSQSVNPKSMRNIKRPLPLSESGGGAIDRDSAKTPMTVELRDGPPTFLNGSRPAFLPNHERSQEPIHPFLATNSTSIDNAGVDQMLIKL